MIDKNIKDLEIRWLEENDWSRMRDFLVNKFQECKTEKQFNFILEALIGSLFKNPEELDKYREDFKKQRLTELEKKQFREAIQPK